MDNIKVFRKDDEKRNKVIKGVVMVGVSAVIVGMGCKFLKSRRINEKRVLERLSKTTDVAADATDTLKTYANKRYEQLPELPVETRKKLRKLAVQMADKLDDINSEYNGRLYDIMTEMDMDVITKYDSVIGGEELAMSQMLMEDAIKHLR